MYPLETRELAVEAVAAGFSLTEAAELAGCSRTAVVNWAKAAGVAPPPRKKAVYLPFDRKMELVARLEAGERAADLAAEAGVTAAAVSGWRRRLREEGALSLMTDSDIAARAPEPREAPSELEELRARCEELELRNAVLEGTIDILKKDPGADLSALTAAERAALEQKVGENFTYDNVKLAETGTVADGNALTGDVSLPKPATIGVDGKYYEVKYTASTRWCRTGGPARCTARCPARLRRRWISR